MIDTKISLDSILTIIGFIATAIVMYSKIIERFSKVETKVEALWAVLMKKLEDVQNGQH